MNIKSKNKKFQYTLWVFFMIWNVFISQAQPIDAKVDVVSVKQGVDGLEVTNFFLTDDRNIWLKTDNCLNICNPKSIKNVYFGEKSNNIHSNKNIIELRENIKFIDIFYEGNFSFYDKYDKTTEEIEKIPLNKIDDNIPQEYLKTILFENKIYIFTQNKNQLMVNDIYQNSQSKIDISNLSRIKDIIIYNQGYYLLLENDNIYNYNKENLLTQIEVLKPYNFKKYTFEGKVVEQKKQIFHLDSKNRLWYSILGYPGVFTMDNSKYKMYLYDDLLQNRLYTWVSEDKKGRLIFGSTNRYRFTREFYLLDENNILKEWNYLRTKFVIPRKVVSDDFYDEMFVSTYRNLIVLNFNSHDFISKYYVNEKIKNEEGGYGNIIWGITQISDDSIFVTSEFPFWGIFNSNDIHSNPSRYNYTKGMYFLDTEYCKKDRTLWIRSKVKNTIQLLKLNPNTLEHEFIQSPKPIYSFTSDGIENLYCSSKSTKGIYNISFFDKKNKSFEKIRDIPFNPFFMKLDSTNNSIWCLDYFDGAYKVDITNDTSKIKKLDLGLIGAKYLSINFGSKNRIFVSTTQGLLIWDTAINKLIGHLTVKNGLSANNVCTAQEDFKGNLWISTFSGLNYYNQETEIIKNYFVKDGIPNEEFNQNSSFIDNKNNIYFGSANGLIKIDVERFYEKRFSISVNKILLFNDYERQVIKELPKDRIRIHQDNISKLELDILYDEWSNKDNVKFYNKLSPVDNRWSQITNENKIVIKNFPIGNYTLNIFAINDEGIESNTISVPFRIYEKWYEKLWFLTFITLVIAGTLFFGGIYYYEVQKGKKEKRKLQFEKKVSELELGILRGQMNPHFVFNSIGAIQGKLNSGENELVSQYLNDFASLMRLYLESSRSKTISLREEIELLKLYVNLEKMRFEDKIFFEINVDPDIDKEYTSIPTMVLQPFVENAINHGLFHKTTQGHLWINILENNEESNIIISIIDDGVGRKRAHEIRQNSFPRHKSRAMQIVEDRIDVLKKIQDYFIEIEIKDLYDEEQNATGTAVYITIPK